MFDFAGAAESDGTGAVSAELGEGSDDPAGAAQSGLDEGEEASQDAASARMTRKRGSRGARTAAV